MRAPVCQPDAISRPYTVRRAASGSIWKGWGSNLRPNSMISASSITVEPNVKRSPPS